ncbi:hypothetical protein CFC21_038913 [Triticum aestivum]|uniref:Uncharacterized protein n=1 Tax=Triticum aestivum TaxID=4565 RepID=A0A9R1FEB7_WHEAT|nr:hypothetical protein CFC21_038913 [Triticum aestivum]
MEWSQGSQQRKILSDAQTPPVPSGLPLFGKVEKSDVTWSCIIVFRFTLLSSVGNLLVVFHYDGTSKDTSELLTGTMEAVICFYYLSALAPWNVRPNERNFVDTGALVIMSYLLLLDINLSFLWLALLPTMAIVFIGALYIKLNHHTSDSYGKVTPESSNIDEKTIKTPMELRIIDEKTIKTPMELRIIVVVTFGALLVMDQLDDDTAGGFTISQFLLFLSSTVAALTCMVMKLPADRFLGSAPASELLQKTLLLLLLVTVHTLAAELLGEDVVLFCMPEVIPVLLWLSLNLDRPHHSPLTNIYKMKRHMKGLTIALGVVVVVPLFAYLVSSMDVSGLSYCTTIMVACGISGVLTYYIVFMLNYWHWPWQKQQATADSSSKDDVHSSGMLKFWADVLLIAAAVLLLLRYMVDVRLDLQQPL